MGMIETKTANAIRVLSADAIQKAKSGHPGLPLGCASAAYELWANHMRHNPADPKWVDRDRFILSGGHGSMLLYSLFHLFGYGDLSMEDLKNFRQIDSLTPGHPEYGHTVGVEATTGPLGQGMGMAVGMAMAEAHLASVFNKDDIKIVDHYTYVLGGDGCMMEGLSSEAFSLAGTLGLGKLIVLYDSNNISIEGNTDIAFTEDTAKRFESYGFGVFQVEDGNDFAAIGAAIEAAKAEGELTVYGSCEEEYLSAACQNFEKLYGIKTKYQRLSTSEVYTKVSEEAGKPSADVWFGGTMDPYNEAVAAGLLEPYDAINAVNLIGDEYKDPTNCWYGIYKGILGFMVNTDELTRMGLEAPKDWPDLLKEEYKGLIWMSNYNTAGTAKLVINTMIQKYGHDEGIKYLVDLDKNIHVYTKSGSGPSKNVGSGECVIGIGFLHDGITQILDNGYKNISLIIPSSGTSFEIGATAIFKGAAHPNAAKLWIEYALSPDCVELAQDNGSYQFLVIDNAKQPEVAEEFGLDPENVMDYDFEDAKTNIKTYIAEVMDALGGGDDRFKTE